MHTHWAAYLFLMCWRRNIRSTEQEDISSPSILDFTYSGCRHEGNRGDCSFATHLINLDLICIRSKHRLSFFLFAFIVTEALYVHICLILFQLICIVMINVCALSTPWCQCCTNAAALLRQTKENLMHRCVNSCFFHSTLLNQHQTVCTATYCLTFSLCSPPTPPKNHNGNFQIVQ